MKKFALLSLFAVSSLLLNGCVSAQHAVSDTSNCRVRVRAFIDGCDVIKIRGGQIWIAHKAYELPGRWMGCNEPVIINGDEEWYPNWNGSLSERHEIEDKERILPTKRAFTSDTMVVSIRGELGTVFVSEYPNEENGYTLSVTLDDRTAEGASWYEFGVDWDEEK